MIDFQSEMTDCKVRSQPLIKIIKNSDSDNMLQNCQFWIPPSDNEKNIMDCLASNFQYFQKYFYHLIFNFKTPNSELNNYINTTR